LCASIESEDLVILLAFFFVSTVSKFVWIWCLHYLGNFWIHCDVTR
jgi:hypothetical protein